MWKNTQSFKNQELYTNQVHKKNEDIRREINVYLVNDKIR